MSRFNLRTPGVYIQEINQPQPIQGAPTNTIAFIGETKTGPTTPTLITSWQQFMSVFGGNFGTEKYLPYTVEGFFLNGGQRCIICRVVDADFAGAVAKLEAVEEVSIVYAPNAQATPKLAELLIAHCERMKRFGIFDSLKGQAPSSITKPKASSYAALYYPWIQVKPSGATQTCLVPPGGAIAGLYARTDLERGVHKAPANQPVKGAVDLERAVNDAEQDMLNPLGVNCIRMFPSRGILVWGARTLTNDSEYKYINVRRLLLFLEESIKKGTNWTIFEPNNETTWAKVRLQVENFLMQSWQKGIFMGTKPQEAYFVRCDRSTMTQDDLDNGKLILIVGVAAVKPAEFLLLHIVQSAKK